MHFFGISIICFLVIVIWWEIVDYNEFKFTKEEKGRTETIKKNLEKKNKKRINNSKLLFTGKNYVNYISIFLNATDNLYDGFKAYDRLSSLGNGGSSC
ncbi:MAG: hypothetical protein L6U99_13895 [Clostridium sp.]|nr:MAG: hypothetical protein L6U99_13895 [Clostridium sp.]